MLVLAQSHSVSMSMSLAIRRTEDHGAYVLYVISMVKDGRRWEVHKRYSELHSFYQSIATECSGKTVAKDCR